MRLKQFMPLLVPAALYAIWLLFPITIITADIGRHLMDGKILLSNPDQWGALLYSNFYSMSNPDFPIINHHWAAGIVFALIHMIAGWYGLHVFAIALCVTALLLIVHLSSKTSSSLAAATVAVALLPMLGYRHEIRPEFIAYFLLGLMMWISMQKGSTRLLYLLPALQLAWVNIHASFPIGIALIGLRTIDSLIKKSDQKKWMTVLAASVVATLLNPSLLSGALYPLSILQDPGYAVLENQSITFLGSIGVTNTAFTMLKLCAVALLLCIGLLWYQKRLSTLWLHCALAALVTLMAFLAVRHITLAAFLLIPVFASVARGLHPKALASLMVVAALWNGYLLHGRWIVLGVEPSANAAAKFMQDQNISGPIFNNFDIGGYLIYHFYPDMKPYVYNRPESHPSEFWTDTFVPAMQENARWYQLLDQEKFNAIVLFHGDRTTWAQKFLLSRIKDPIWEAVFVDRSIIIFVKKNEENASVIQRFGIAPSALLKQQ